MIIRDHDEYCVRLSRVSGRYHSELWHDDYLPPRLIRDAVKDIERKAEAIRADYLANDQEAA